MNLIDGGIQHSRMFLHMPLFDEISYQGSFENKVKKFRAVHEDQPCQILALDVIRKDEEVIWDAFLDLIKRSVAQAAAAVRGVYTFELLTMEIHKEVKTFNHQEIAGVLVNHARKCPPGGKRLVKYSSVYGILQNLNAVDWGKITVKSAVDVFKDKPCFLDLLVKALIKNFEFAHDPGILILNDLSQEPLFNGQDEQQQQRLKAVIEKQIPKSIEFLPEIYVQDKNGVRELLSGSVIA
ncbi:MAG TPA: hypothetical protein P5246_03380 [Candidatus Omnitrophota bacterium]|nr:hypothetical protein [Candidatus Omnitrophota bacterium]HSA31796.1 hypothetical protein [Candidatus Omnitrophota bacterium]